MKEEIYYDTQYQMHNERSPFIHQGKIPVGESAVEEDNDWYIYEPDDILSLSTPCYIAPRPEFDENEEEIFPEYAIENNMDYSIMPELVTDVVINAIDQKRDATEEELLKALNYYLDADTFIKL